jgi:hypothetical protein
MKRLQGQNAKGQSLVEFTLIAPLVFFIFFAIIQLIYMAYVFFAVQNAAFSIVRKAAASVDPNQYNPAFDLVYALAPLEKINPVLVETALATQCQIQTQADQVQISLHYPMIIWIPLFQRLFGQKLSSPVLSQNLDPNILENVFGALKIPVPALESRPPQAPYVHWFVVTATALDENSVPATAATGSPL